MTFDSTNPVGRSESEEAQRIFIAAFEAAAALRRRADRLADSDRPQRSRQNTHRRRNRQPLHRTGKACLLRPRARPPRRPTLHLRSPQRHLILRTIRAGQQRPTPHPGTDSAPRAPPPGRKKSCSRYSTEERTHQLPTIVTTSTNIADIDPYISSRMTNSGPEPHSRVPRSRPGACQTAGETSPEGYASVA